MLTPKRPEATCLIAERRESPLASRRVADGVLPALAGVRAPAEAVHRDRQRLVGLARERAERHRAGREVLDDLLRRLDLLERQPLVLGQQLEAQQPAQRRAPGRVLVHQLRVLLERLGAAVADRVLEQRDRLRVPHVVLALAAPRVDAADRQQVLVRARVGAGVAVERLAREHVDADAADPRRGAREVRLDQLGREADGLEDLRARVGLDRRDPHLRDRLEQALGDALDDALLGLVDRHRRRAGGRRRRARSSDSNIRYGLIAEAP